MQLLRKFNEFSVTFTRLSLTLNRPCIHQTQWVAVEVIVVFSLISKIDSYTHTSQNIDQFFNFLKFLLSLRNSRIALEHYIIWENPTYRAELQRHWLTLSGLKDIHLNIFPERSVHKIRKLSFVCPISAEGNFVVNVKLKSLELLRLRLNVSVDKDVKTRNLFVLWG